MAEPTRILVVGDLHANTGAGLEVIEHAAAIHADLIVQLGDWGHWPRDKQGRSFQLKMKRRLALRGLELWWICGNHEDADRLAVRTVGEDGRRQISDHIWNLPTGLRWQ